MEGFTKVVSERNAAGVMVKYVDHYQLYKKWDDNGQFMTRNGRRYNLVKKYKYTRVA